MVRPLRTARSILYPGSRAEARSIRTLRESAAAAKREREAAAEKKKAKEEKADNPTR